MADKNTANIGFEKQIWDAACVLRGNMDASEYKNVVLGLIFLKYISDRFDDKYQELLEEGDGFEEDIDEYTSEGIFFVPAGARWNEIAAKAHTPEIGTVIDDAMRAIEKENKRLKDILPKNFARPELDKRRLGDVVDLFTNIQMIEHGSEKDILGRTYEYCLSMFAEQEGKRGGEFFTPSCVVRTLVEVKLKTFDTGSLLQKNIIFMDYLQNGITVKLFVKGEEQSSIVRLIDYENEKKNSFYVVNQFTFLENGNNRRPDVILFINGLPLVLMELKSPSKDEVGAENAYNQIRNYMKDII